MTHPDAQGILQSNGIRDRRLVRFSKLRLTGFKSFVDPTELLISDGLTGVVGPNGCGKSNLLEGNQDAFSSPKLFHEMKEADYLLQYHLYTLALHRFLSQSNTSGYDYDQSFGGVYYLFIRGMCQGNSPDDGIFFDRPSKSIIQAMDHFLALQK